MTRIVACLARSVRHAIAKRRGPGTALITIKRPSLNYAVNMLKLPVPPATKSTFIKQRPGPTAIAVTRSMMFTRASRVKNVIIVIMKKAGVHECVSSMILLASRWLACTQSCPVRSAIFRMTIKMHLLSAIVAINLMIYIKAS